jgi:hypothetical protein
MNATPEDLTNMPSPEIPMAPDTESPNDQDQQGPTVFEAERASGPSGAVERLSQLDFDGAVARRKAGNDIVVCGDDPDANRRLAFQIENNVGQPSKPQFPHKRAGPLSLPHFHQLTRNPDGHTFYETDKRKSRKQQ